MRIWALELARAVLIGICIACAWLILDRMADKMEISYPVRVEIGR